ncbi:hypothetical protein [Chitinophaga varians]|uniref:hypothetical protein n=1 Tax=Chitinophaga varians TaxID=2202339 RepID=UPI00165F373C|nr:hypothetical protein [Chitinophaga varians]MBC9911788.1 hypothetical protein [Chitinophaga varians]
MYYKLSILLLLLWLFAGCSGKTVYNADAAEKEARHIVDNLDKPATIKYFQEQYFNPDKVNDLIKKLQACNWKAKECWNTSTGMTYESGKTTAHFSYACTSVCGKIAFTLTFNVDHDKPELVNLKVEESLGNEK